MVCAERIESGNTSTGTLGMLLPRVGHEAAIECLSLFDIIQQLTT